MWLQLVSEQKRRRGRQGGDRTGHTGSGRGGGLREDLGFSPESGGSHGELWAEGCTTVRCSQVPSGGCVCMSGTECRDEGRGDYAGPGNRWWGWSRVVKRFCTLGVFKDQRVEGVSAVWGLA